MKIKTQQRDIGNILFIVLGLMLLLSPEVFAANSGGSALPWESSLSKLVDSVKGPVAFGISVVAIVGAGVGLIMGQEISAFLKVSLMLSLVIAIIVGAVNILSTLFGVAGALI